MLLFQTQVDTYMLFVVYQHFWGISVPQKLYLVKALLLKYSSIYMFK